MSIATAKRLFTLLSLALAPHQLTSFPTFAGAAVIDRNISNQPPTIVDVVVVGAGFSGLMSAYELDQAGLTTAVLEAKEQIGGRSRSYQRRSGPGVIELGATWINNMTQPKVFALTQHFGLETAEQYTDGISVFQAHDGRVLRLLPGNLTNSDDPEEAMLEEQIIGSIDYAASQVDIKNFDKFPKDQDVTVAQWLAKLGLWNHPHAEATVSGLTSALVGREPEELGAHYLFDYINSGGGLFNLSTEGKVGAQSLKIKQGTTAIATSLASALTKGNVHVNTPVTSISDRNGTVLVTTATGQLFQAKKVILAIPSNTYGDINFSPPLPCDKKKLVSSTKAGIYAKLILSYAEPWWRNAGLVGKFTSHVGPACFSWDTSDPSQSQYSLAIFVAGKIAAKWHELPSAAAKERAVVEHLAVLAGPELADKALDTLEINFVEWTMEEFLYGAPTSTMGPGLLRKYGKTLREPFGSVHIGGGETAYEWKGYLEGAISAGERAAKEVIEALKGVKTGL